ncbi:MAG: LacI family transcriptional regulator [Clostridiales bacterium]|jgi:LacI family transcriptional regulator|nr:LacI family transcriptional regulator [Clostridiales bacterium]
MSKSISLKDVAKYAGVGLGTASRVLNNHPSVNSDTKQLVLNAMKELNYEPNAIARSLKIKSTSTIGVIVPDITSAFFPEVVRGIEDSANVYQYNIILCNTDLNHEKEKEALGMLSEKKVDGILFISNTVSEDTADKFTQMDIPVVLIATADGDKNNFPSITIDNQKAAYDAVDYLCKLGHRNICMISGKADDPNAGIPRVLGYKEALKDNNIAVDNNMIYEGDYNYISGYVNMLKILELDRIPTAVFVASDIMAIGASKAILEKGLRIPEDISIMGFDGVEAAEFFYPSISTIVQPRYAMGAVAMHLLVKLISKQQVDEKNVVLEHKLIERQSCKRLK